MGQKNKIVIGLDIFQKLPEGKMNFLSGAEVQLVHVAKNLTVDGEHYTLIGSEEEAFIRISVLDKLKAIATQIVPEDVLQTVTYHCLFSPFPRKAFCDYLEENNVDLTVLFRRQTKPLLESSFSTYIAKRALSDVFIINHDSKRLPAMSKLTLGLKLGGTFNISQCKREFARFNAASVDILHIAREKEYSLYPELVQANYPRDEGKLLIEAEATKRISKIKKDLESSGHEGPVSGEVIFNGDVKACFGQHMAEEGGVAILSSRKGRLGSLAKELIHHSVPVLLIKNLESAPKWSLL